MSLSKELRDLVLLVLLVVVLDTQLMFLVSNCCVLLSVKVTETGSKLFVSYNLKKYWKQGSGYHV